MSKMYEIFIANHPYCLYLIGEYQLSGIVSPRLVLANQRREFAWTLLRLNSLIGRYHRWHTRSIILYKRFELNIKEENFQQSQIEYL